MAFNVSALADYVAANRAEFILASHFGNVTSGVIPQTNKLKGVKTTMKLPTLDSSVNLQDGNTCGVTTGGTTSLGSRTLTVGYVMDYESLCMKALRVKFDSVLPMGNKDSESLLNEKAIVDSKIAAIADVIGTANQIGDTGRSNANYNKYDGFIKQITGSTVAISANTYAGVSLTAATFTAASAYTIVNGVIGNFPANILKKQDLKLFMGLDTYKLYAQALITQNNYHFSPEETKNYRNYHPFSNVEVVADPGLDGTSWIWGTYAENLWEGGDDFTDEQSLQVWYSQDDDALKTRISFAKGVQVSRPSECVYWQIGAF